MTQSELTAPAMADLARQIAAERRVPTATYRLQFNSGFRFREAAELVPYLAALGISDCYASPILKARAGSTHGYDICDHGQLNPDLGSEDDFAAFCGALQSHGMGLMLDTVPNHMGIFDAANSWWTDVLENGPSSNFSSYFDIDWHPVKQELRNKVLLPILEDQYGKVLESGKLRLSYEDGAFFVYHYATKLPVAPRSFPAILSLRLGAVAEILGSDHPHVLELRSILTAINYLPSRTETDSDKIIERNREKEVIKRRIAALHQASPFVRVMIDEAVSIYNGRSGDPASFDPLDQLLNEQVYRLAFWRVATEEINYRRFFDISDLAAIRMEAPAVFEATHQLIFRLLAEGKVTGLRIDHPDGLRNPPAYFRDLQRAYLRHRLRALLDQRGVKADTEGEILDFVAGQFEQAGRSALVRPLYIVAEKILSKGEALPDEWEIHGTTGYEFANAVNGLFVDSANRREFDAIYGRFTRQKPDFRTLVNSTKKMIMLVALASEINMLSHHLNSISEKSRWYRDFTLNSLTFALREVIACLPVYRTYITDLSDPVDRRDQAVIEAAISEAKRRNPRTAEAIFDFLQDTLLFRNVQNFQEEDREELNQFVLEFQQVTGPVMAKAVEDTAFYQFNRLLSLNEVGGDPEQFGITVAAFHRQNAERRRRWPHSMLTTSTHDTKRSEDVRARISVLSEMPGEWRAALTRWSRLNRRKETRAAGLTAPDRNDEYLLYQTLVGAWPGDAATPREFEEFRERIAAYMLKATKEAKVHTSWVNANEDYDAAVRNFVLRILDRDASKAFLADFQALQRRVAHFGRINSLAQVLLKLTSPGVPDLYQGTELWDLSLVDPDNRRPVDFGRRRRLLAELTAAAAAAGLDRTALARGLVESPGDGRDKLYLTAQTLNFRRANAELFQSGNYLPLDAAGDQRDHVCAFARSLGEASAIIVVPRLVVGLLGGAVQAPLGGPVWQETWLALPHEEAGQRYRNRYTGEILAVSAEDGVPGLALADICAHFPVALLERLAA